MAQSPTTSRGRGITYESRIIMLHFTRGFTRKIQDFRLEYQVPDAGKFDDVIFDEGGEMYHMIQLKHKEREDGMKITHLRLFSENYSADFNLLKYVISIIESPPRFKNNKIKSAIVFTNVEFNLKDNSVMPIIGKKDYFGDIDAIKLYPVEMDYNCVIDCSYNYSKAKFYKFDGDENVVKILKNLASYYVTKLKQEQSQRKCPNNITQTKKLKDETSVLINSLENLSEHQIREALHLIVYGVGQPNDDNLEEVIKSEIRSHYKLENVDDIYNNLEVSIRKWCDTKIGLFPKIIKFEHAAKFFEGDFKTISFDVQKPISSFTGRLDIMNQMREKLHNKQHDIALSHTLIICGLGGVGKTELVRQFIKLFGTSDFYNRVIWINSENDTAVEESFKRLAEKLGIDIRGKNYVKNIIDEVFDYFEGLKVLFVYDNYEKGSENIKENYVTYCWKYVSQSNKQHRPYFLFTSRDKHCLHSHVTSITLDVLTKNEAIELIKQELQAYQSLIVDEREVETLVEILQYFPLALRQAISYIKQQKSSQKNYSITYYLTEFKTNKNNWLDHTFEDDFGQHEKTLLITWNITFQVMKKNKYGNYAIKFLQYMSYLYADDIDPCMFRHYLKNNNSSKSVIENALNLLERYSMITKNVNSYRIHRLIQKIVRIKCQISERQYVKETMRLINPELINVYKKKSHILTTLIKIKMQSVNHRYEQLVNSCSFNEILHFNSIASYLKKYEKSYKNYKGLFKDINKKNAENLLYNDDLDMLKLLEVDDDFLEKFIQKNLQELIERKCNCVLKHYAERRFYFIKTQAIHCDKTPLYYSAFYENLDILKYFLDKGADANQRTKDGKLLVDIFKNNFEIFCLLHPKTSYRACDNYEYFWIVEESFLSKFIEEKQNSVSITSEDGFTFLHFACFFECLGLIEDLVEKGIDVSVRDKEGKTALYYAYEKNLREIYIFLLNKTTSLDEETLLLAIERDDVSVVEKFLGTHLTHDQRLTNGKTALEIATEKFSRNVVIFLKRHMLLERRTDDTPRETLIRCAKIIEIQSLEVVRACHDFQNEIIFGLLFIFITYIFSIIIPMH